MQAKSRFLTGGLSIKKNGAIPSGCAHEPHCRAEPTSRHRHMCIRRSRKDKRVTRDGMVCRAGRKAVKSKLRDLFSCLADYHNTGSLSSKRKSCKV